MEIDYRFCIQLKRESLDWQISELTIPASEFFDAAEYAEPEWGCDLPWRHLSLTDYFRPEESESRSLSLSIIDLVTNQNRIVHTQFLAGNKLTLSWSDRRANPNQFEIILDIEKDAGNVAEIARMQVGENDVRLASHVLIEGASCKSLL